VSVTRFFHPVLPSRALRKKPKRAIVDGEAYVLFRDAGGRACALVDRCPHRFAPLSRGRVDERGHLQCAYHGWTFDGEGHGESASQPSLTKCDARAMRCEERHDYVWISARDSITSVPSWSFGAHRFCGAFAMRFDAPLHVVLDNFSEDEHTPFVHTRLGWRDRDVHRIEFDAENHDDHTRVHYAAPQRPTRVGRLFGLRPGDIFHNDWVTRFDPVCTIYETHWVDPKSGAKRPLRITSPIFFVPETTTTTMLHTFVFADVGEPYARFFSALRHVATAVAWGEIRDDARFVPILRDTPASMRGMRLGKFDKPLVHNRKLLDAIYFGREGGERIFPTGS
jgi:phenylpropionate dioxygenase-like ring-hydroxylating dioxygenase large terminal subunit